MSYALNSLIDILLQILNPQKHHKNWVLDDEYEEDIETLLKKAYSVRDFLVKPPPSVNRDKLQTLEKQVIFTAEQVENKLESCITELILLSTDPKVLITISPPDDLGDPFEVVEYQIKCFMDAANRKNPDVDADQVPDDDRRGGDADQGLNNKPPSMRNHMGKLIVGLKQDLSDLDNQIRKSSKTEIISIVGKLGTGKTTLAQLIYHRHLSTTPPHFDYRLWATVPRDSNSKQIREGESKETKWKKILQTLLDCLLKEDVQKEPEQQLLTEEKVQKKKHVQQYDDLFTVLHKRLMGRRCLIVLDGIQEITDWDDVKLAFMNAIGQGSRILLTTRKHDVATSITSQIHQMRPLNNDECWELLRENVYGKELCPYELEKVGKRIASNCKGLPLEVQQVGADLSNVKKHKDSWEVFAVSLKSRNLVVGVDNDLMILKDQLLGGNTGLEIIPIVGMGGTGKTTLARILFDELSLGGSHFDVCAWTMISQTYDPRRALQSLLDCVTEKPMMHVQEIGELVNTLRQYLLSSRYLILLDDIWSSEPLDYLRKAFPNNNRGSRIIFTTRIKEWDTKVCASNHEIKPLEKNDSWELLRRKVFDNDSFPVELEEVGKQIANRCRGLPLAIQVVGGLLSQAKRSKSSWEHVAEDVSSFIEKEDEQFSGIFSWSYFHLPHYLKPCFLYMGSFPEDYVIQASKLIKLWVSDGFLSPFEDRSPEEAAERYLTDLVARSLILVSERKANLKVKSYGIHDLLRDLCLKKARETNFLYVRDSKTNNLEVARDQRRVSVHLPSDCMEGNDGIPVKLTSLVRSFQPIGLYTEKILSSLCFEFSLLRQLDLFETVFHNFPEEILKLVNLRYLAMRCRSGLPEKIYVLRNLQTLIFQIMGIGFFAGGIFDLPQIRHVELTGSLVLKPVDLDRSFAVQENLQSLSNVPSAILKRLVGKIPNLRKLGVQCSLLSGSPAMVDLTCFKKLETLQCSSDLSTKSEIYFPELLFPYSLQKVTLRQCIVRRTSLRKLGELPNLKILKLEGIKMEKKLGRRLKMNF